MEEEPTCPFYANAKEDSKSSGKCDVTVLKGDMCLVLRICKYWFVKRDRGDKMGFVLPNVLQPIGTNHSKPTKLVLTTGTQIVKLMEHYEAVDEVLAYLSVHPDHIDKTWKWSVGFEGTFLVFAAIFERPFTKIALLKKNANKNKKFRVILASYAVAGALQLVYAPLEKNEQIQVLSFLGNKELLDDQISTMKTCDGKTVEQLQSLRKLNRLKAIDTTTKEAFTLPQIHSHTCYFTIYRIPNRWCDWCKVGFDEETPQGGFSCYECSFDLCRKCAESLVLQFPTSPQQLIPSSSAPPSRALSPPPVSPTLTQQISITSRMVMDVCVPTTSVSPLFPLNYSTTINIHDAASSAMKPIWNESLTEYYQKLVSEVLTQPNAVATTKKYGLTINEAAAITYYTTGGEQEQCLFRVLNLNLALRNPCVEWQPFLWYFISGLKKLPPIATVVYRAWGKSLSRQEVDTYIQGKVITWPAFSSTSRKCSIVDSFSPETKQATWFVLNITEGRDISNFSVYPVEDEVLLLPGTQFTVNAAVAKEFKVLIKIPDDLHLISMTELQNNPYDAVSHGLFEKLQKWHTDNPQININTPGPDNNTLIYLAARNGHASIVEWLIQEGANVNVTQNTGSTPLHVAAYRSQPEVCKILLQHKEIRVDIKNKHGFTAEEEAVGAEVVGLFKK